MPSLQHWRRQWPALVSVVCLLILVAYALFPVLWMVSTALKPTPEIRTANPTFIPSKVTWVHFKMVLLQSGFLGYVRNSLVVALSVTFTALVVATMAGYSLSRFRQLPGITVAAVAMLVAQMVPSVLLIVPLYIIMKNLGLLNTYWSLILAYTTFVVPLSTWMLKGYFDQVPIEIEESAQIDGCNPLGVVWRVVIPVSIPGLMTTALYAFVHAWNEFLFGYTFISRDEFRTLTPGMANFIGLWTVEWGPLMAAAVLGVLPVTLAYLYLQRFLIQGLSAGSTKG